MELSKHDKKIARKLLDIALQREFARGLLQASEMLKRWNPVVEDHEPSYYALFKHVSDFDKHIARRYDDLRGWQYFFKVAELLNEGIITPAEISEFFGGGSGGIEALETLVWVMAPYLKEILECMEADEYGCFYG